MKKPIILFDIDDTLFDTEAFRDSGLTTYQLYPDVLPALTKLSSFATLGIFSEAKYTFQDGKITRTEGILSPQAYEFQFNKLIKTHIAHFFSKEHLHIVGNKAASFPDVLSAYTSDHVYFVDDKLPFLQEAATVLPSLNTIWLRRGRFAQTQMPIPGFTPGHRIDSLVEIESIVRREIDR